jgi:alkylation response protein AidB-like acyl-CoA dehydrogenase
MMMNLNAEDRQFQQEIRSFMTESLPEDIRYKVVNNLFLKKDDHVRWQKILYEGGYFAGNWPTEFGGQGWSVIRQYIFEQENALAGAPFIIPYGVSMVGPVIYTFGSKAQQEEHLAGILSSDVWWCQGYSEPNAGSDLASLKCSAKREGDHYVINGTKMWTTQAHYADKMHILVRTDDSGRKQEGITFLTLDMNTPGISISPIVTIDGLHHTNQTFFDDVRVPVSNRIGEEGDGWKIANFLLSHERTAIADTGSKSRGIGAIKARLARLEKAFPNSPENTIYRFRLLQLEAELTAIVAIEQRLLTNLQAGRRVSFEASVLKIRATELQQAISVLISDMNGPYRAVYDVERIDSGQQIDHPTTADEASGAGHLYLYGRCSSIYGGSNEIQRNIIARSVLPR